MKIENPTTPQKTGEYKLGTKIVEGRIVGRDKTVVPPEEVEKLASIGCKDKEIAEWFGINDNTLRFNFSVELTKGRCHLKQTLRRAMFTNAITNNNTVMQIFLAKNFLDMSDNGAISSDEPLPWIESEEYIKNQEADQSADNQEDESNDE
jgi:hypothetical protein